MLQRVERRKRNLRGFSRICPFRNSEDAALRGYPQINLTHLRASAEVENHKPPHGYGMVEFERVPHRVALAGCGFGGSTICFGN
jgi:hypothetical protein